MACPEVCEATPNAKTHLKERLHLASTTTCEKFISCIKFSQMKKNFREIYNENPETLKNIHDQLCSQMKKSVMEDFSGICEEHCIDFLLDSLELLKKNQESSQHSWRPTGEPEEDLRDHIYPLKLKLKEDLQTVLTKLQLSNEELINEASVNHGEILHLKKSNDDLHKVFSDMVSSLTGTNLKNLQETLLNRIEEA